MARTAHRTTSTSKSSGAFEVDKNIATIAGYATLAGGVTLAGAAGTMVAPAPVLGLTAIGGGLVVAGNFHDIKAHFAGPKAPLMQDRPSSVDVTEGGKYASVEDATDGTVAVETQAVTA